jgi:cytochrome c553
MTFRLFKTLACAAICLAVINPANSQSNKAASGSDSALRARVKEVESNPRLLETALKGGAKVASFCSNCHGDGGNSVKPDVPNLAGQNASYLMEQLRRYLDSSRHTTDFKRRLIKVLSLDEKVNMVAFYSRQPVTPKPPADPAVVAKAKGMYARLCADCHEANGHGNEDYSRVAGQQLEYMTMTLKAYRDKPTPGMVKDMVDGLKGVSDTDIHALAVYVGAMN